VGGKSLTWGGITLRLSDYEFKAGQWDGRSPCWRSAITIWIPTTPDWKVCLVSMANGMDCPSCLTVTPFLRCPSPRGSATCNRRWAGSWASL
jgi:hypothetical protein